MSNSLSRSVIGIAQKSSLLAILTVAAFSLLSGCMNMPTPPAQITGAYVSPVKYDGMTCDQLSTELAGLARRENALVTAQQGRYKTSEVQAFWWGYGQGDGIEASELASVRGEAEAVRSAMDRKGCEIPASLAVITNAPTGASATHWEYKGNGR